MPELPIDVIISLWRPMSYFSQLLDLLPYSIRSFVVWCFAVWGVGSALRIMRGD